MSYNQALTNKLYEYFTKSLGMYDYTKGWVKGDCPFCGKDNKFGINLSTGRANCFVCGDKGNPIKVIMSLQGLETYTDFTQFINIFEGKEYHLKQLPEKHQVELELPPHYTLITLGDSEVAKAARSYLRDKRGFNISKLALQGVGYCGMGEYFGYIIIPYYINNTLVYYNARRFLGSGPRYKNPTETASGIGKSMVLYNLEALFIYKKVYLLEGAINALTLGEKGVGTGGKKISDWQLSVILNSPVSDIVLLYDPDAIQDILNLSLQLIPHKRVKVIILPDDKDVNDLGKKQTIEIIRKSTWTNWNELIKLKNNKGLIIELERQHLHA